ncbi:BQ2448_3151 [Microbotryum intermedium]|uniref:BQ2448_3151 protein n=1 Tax=Microbotryum intermedium TaxID=269621 RepID=A0A238FHV3_9BASI|nr:BQ2448_3151 [Microbotryum intermedium]
MASSSQWIWDPTYSLYYNPSTQQWARLGADGAWVYANATSSQVDPDPDHVRASTRSAVSASSSSATAQGKRRYYDRDDPDAVEHVYTAIPEEEEQVWPFSDDEHHDDHLAPRNRGKWAHDRYEPSLDGVAAPLLRLVVDRSRVFQKGHVILIPPDEPVQLGRDKAFDKRIRLKELQVSKTHATLFFTPFHVGVDAGEWQVIDGGSTHGTFVKSSTSTTTTSAVEWVRLSRDKVASEPKTLHHLDLLRIGTTSFSIHIHPSLPCSTCSIKTDESNLIPLSTSEDHQPTSLITDGTTSLGPTPYTAVTKEQKEFDRRERMKGLKEQHRIGASPKTLTMPASEGDGVDPSSTSMNKTQFIDRAKIRRERNLGAGEALRPSSTKTSQSTSKASSGPFFTVPGANATHSVASTSSTARPIDPFASESKGAQLLAKVGGGAKGIGSSTIAASTTITTTMSTPRGLGQLIDPKVLNGDAKSGLGSRPLKALWQPVVVNDAKPGGWREDVREASRKRWKEMEGRG